jgi:hypothetical protein
MILAATNFHDGSPVAAAILFSHRELLPTTQENISVIAVTES